MPSRSARITLVVAALASGVATVAATAGAQSAPARRLVLLHANVIDGTGTAPLRDATIVISGGRIASIGSAPVSVAGAADTIDIGGRWVVPGLIDAHTHIATTAGMKRALESGVTTVRSANTPHFEDVGLRALVRQGAIAGPEMLAAGVFVTPDLGETILADPRLASFAGGVTTPAQLAALVNIDIDRGADWIKTRATERAGLADQDPRKQVYTVAQLTAIVDAARARGVGVLVHAHGDEGARAAVLAGARTIEHGTYLSDSTLRLMKARGTCFTPTYTTLVDLSEPGGDYDSAPLALRGTHMIPRAAEAIRMAHAMGVPVITGVDTEYGPQSTSRVSLEVAHFASLGMTPMEAIRAATAVAARCLGIDTRVGTLRVGMEADLAVFERNPLDDIRALQDAVIVIADGRVALKRIPFGLP
ncbi:MAG: amidohydrolase family protein [Gemmatimonadaceae bacterium]|nr:amidohydrolase family protein [Gemmatimonadaceae bacterium]